MRFNKFIRVYGGVPGADKSAPTEARIIFAKFVIALLRKSAYRVFSRERFRDAFHVQAYE